jgi:hypothetical protein
MCALFDYLFNVIEFCCGLLSGLEQGGFGVIPFRCGYFHGTADAIVIEAGELVACMELEVRFIGRQYSAFPVEDLAPQGCQLPGLAFLAFELCDFVLNGRAGQKLHLHQAQNPDKRNHARNRHEDFESPVVHGVMGFLQHSADSVQFLENV